MKPVPIFFALIAFCHLLIAAPKIESLDPAKLVVRDAGSQELKLVVAGGTAAELAERPALLGRWTFDAPLASFVPQFPFNRGTKYRLLIAGTVSALEIELPKAVADVPKLTQIFPSAAAIPENTLRFYLHFDRPMKSGGVYKRVRIVDEKNRPVDQPFLELDEELWNADQTRLTLLIDPGRIKQEVKPREDLGTVFRDGKSYSLVIDGSWESADDLPLGKEIRKPYRISAPVVTAPTPAEWKISPPARKTSAVTLTFPKSMDAGLLMRCISVVDATGTPIAGEVTLGIDEKSWSLTPKQPWAPANYQFVVDTLLEDVSGNGIDRPFEVDAFPPIQKAIATKKVKRDFSVK
jgi:hypothetical protein